MDKVVDNKKRLGDLSGDDVDFLMDVNKMTYRKPLDSSLINTRQKRRYNFSPNNYTVGAGGSSQAEIIVGSGSDYICGPNSYITFKVQSQIANGNASGITTFNTGDSKGSSAMNIFKTCEVVHRSGDQLDYVRDVNSLAQTLAIYGDDTSNLENILPMMGSVSDIKGATDVCLPLWLFSGLFAQEALIPGNLMGGLRIRLEFETFARIIGDTPGDGTAAVKLAITDMALVLDSYVPYDSVASELKDAQSNVKTQGLQYPYYSYYSLTKPFSSTALDFDLNFSAGKIMSLIIKTRSLVDLATNDNMGSEEYDYTRIQARLGSLTFPQHEITTIPEAYFNTLEAFDSNSVNDLINMRKSGTGASYTEYQSAVLVGVPVIGVNLEKSSVLKLSGELTNNSRQLAVVGEFAAGVDTRKVTVWVKHMRVVNIQQDNVTLDR